MLTQPPSIIVSEVTDARQLAEARARRERYARNVAWLRAHAAEIYACHRGRCICIAGQELFVADTPKEALDLARAAHPDDDGRYLRCIPREKVARIYADSRRVASL